MEALQLKPKTFALLDKSLEEQLGNRLYVLEQGYKPQFIVQYLMMALSVDDYKTFDDDDWQCSGDFKEIMYIHAVQIVRYFGKEMVTRILCFNYENEMNKVKEELK